MKLPFLSNVCTKLLFRGLVGSATAKGAACCSGCLTSGAGGTTVLAGLRTATRTGGEATGAAPAVRSRAGTEKTQFW